MLEYGTGAKRLVSTDPWTGLPVGSCSVAAAAEVEEALTCADRRLKAPLPLTERVRLLGAIADSVEDESNRLIDLLVRETGKPVTLAKGEVERMAITFRIASDYADMLERIEVDVLDDRRSEHSQASYQRFPVGAVFGFVPYNWPYNLAAHKIAPAILCGCPLILKASPLAPICTFVLEDLIRSAGVPEGFLKVLHLEDEDAQTLLQDERIKMLSFTGSPRVGWMLRDLVPRKRAALELGGAAPVIVERDADIGIAARKASLSGYGYAGQVCISAQNLYVHESVYARFKDSMIEATENTVSGDPKNPDTICGPLIGEEAVRSVRSFIESGLRDGGDVIASGSVLDHPLLLAPTLLEGMSADSRVVCEEVFGPVLTLQKFSDLESLLSSLNAGKYRLQASVFTRSKETCERVFRRLDFGGVVWNDSPSVRFDAMPYGGEGDSGLGREGIEFAVDEMTKLRALVAPIGT